LVNKNKLLSLFVYVSVVIVSVSVILFVLDIERPQFGEFYNKKFIPAMTDISNIVPANESIVSSWDEGNLAYFAKHKFVVPYNITSQKSLVDFMANNNMNYLLVYENYSNATGLTLLFSRDGLKSLDKDFQEIANYQTSGNSLFHLYRIMDWRTGKAQIPEVNLLDPKNIWKPFGYANVSQGEDQLNIAVTTNKTDKLFNRAFLPLQLALRERPQLLSLEYASSSNKGNATFFIEIRDHLTDKILWSGSLNDTNGRLSNENFILPIDVVNKPVELRFYIITNGPGEHSLIVKKASLPIL
jgi:hypothetical protein